MFRKVLVLQAVIALLAFSINAQTTQNVTVEKSIWGVQTGLLGLWAHNESRLSKTIALRSELGLNGGFAGGTFVEDGFQWVLAPTINIEPRWYYNMRKRAAKGKVTEKNTANFFGLKTAYNSDWFLISSSANNTVIESLTITAQWGIKRTLWQHFTYEVGLGLGYGVEFWKQEGFSENENLIVGNLLLRLGYTF
ncbi:hypothetical protein [Leeuwenhoekiella sp. NPDC079379]|uniref:hypothetical protein n=1 Tax=Leeuwenhoekiella sp. NPDC079379 TaxID=3364122 RepID=UPI0037CA5B9B